MSAVSDLDGGCNVSLACPAFTDVHGHSGHSGVSRHRVCHSYYRDYYDEIKRGLAKDEIFIACFSKIGIAVIMAGLTTVAGFATLYTSAVIPIRDFGFSPRLAHSSPWCLA